MIFLPSWDCHCNWRMYKINTKALKIISSATNLGFLTSGFYEQKVWPLEACAWPVSTAYQQHLLFLEDTRIHNDGRCFWVASTFQSISPLEIYEVDRSCSQAVMPLWKRRKPRTGSSQSHPQMGVQFDHSQWPERSDSQWHQKADKMMVCLLLDANRTLKNASL